MLSLAISNFVATSLTLFCKLSKVASFLYLLFNFAGCILMSLLLKFTHNQAKIMKIVYIFDIEPISYIHTRTYNLLYIMIPFVYV